MLVALATALRLVNGALGSLKLDDFHSLHHARAADLGEFFRVLGQDNHPPVFFLAVRGVRALWGEGPFALRLPTLVFGVALVPLTYHVTRALDARVRLATTLLVACSSLHVECSSDVRMYGLLALASTGFLQALLDVLARARGALAVALWMALGLHTHYHFLYVLALLAGGALAASWFLPELRPARRALLLGLALGLALAAPWYLLVFPRQLGHGLAPGGSNGSLLRLFEGYKNLVLWNISVAGPTLRALGLVASAALLGLVAWGAFALGRERTALARARALLLLLGGLGVPALAALVTHLSPRAGFEWRYVSGALVPLCWLASEGGLHPGALAGLRAAALALVVLVTGAVSLANLFDPGEEDYRGAITTYLAERRPGDLVIAADWQPRLFPHALAFDYYVHTLGGADTPAPLPFHDDFSLVDMTPLATAPRAYACLRSLPDGCALLAALRHYYPHEDVRPFGRSVYLHTFTRD